jgi:hypothetical protein
MTLMGFFYLNLVFFEKKLIFEFPKVTSKIIEIFTNSMVFEKKIRIIKINFEIHKICKKYFRNFENKIKISKNSKIYASRITLPKNFENCYNFIAVYQNNLFENK